MKMKNIYRLGTLALFGTALSACSFLDTDPQIIPAENYTPPRPNSSTVWRVSTAR